MSAKCGQWHIAQTNTAHLDELHDKHYISPNANSSIHPMYSGWNDKS